jgi:trigger factor
MAKEKTDYNKKQAVVKGLIEANPFTLKEEIIEQQVMLEINQISKQMGPQVMQNYMKTSGRNMDDLKKEVRPQAEETIKKNLLLSAIADKILPEVTEEDIQEAISKQPGSFMDFTTDYETRRKRIEEMPGALEQIKHAIRLEKTTDYIVTKAILHERNTINIMDEFPEYLNSNRD